MQVISAGGFSSTGLLLFYIHTLMTWTEEHSHHFLAHCRQSCIWYSSCSIEFRSVWAPTLIIFDGRHEHIQRVQFIQPPVQRILIAAPYLDPQREAHGGAARSLAVVPWILPFVRQSSMAFGEPLSRVAIGCERASPWKPLRSGQRRWAVSRYCRQWGIWIVGVDRTFNHKPQEADPCAHRRHLSSPHYQAAASIATIP